MGQSLACLRVDESTVAITERFGKFDKVLEPGCHCLPFGGRVAGNFSLKAQNYTILSESKTKDNVFLSVLVSVHYRVLREMVKDSFYKCKDIKAVMQVFLIDVVRSAVAKLDLDELYEQKDVIAKAVEGVVGKAMSAYGVHIVYTHITELRVDTELKKAMNVKYAVKVATERKVEGMPRKLAGENVKSNYGAGLSTVD